ncbi:MAG: carboxypeptidase regulatory-like domain-containing protein [Bacteroidota bacterium]|nr:carboxypeptidase regulatory-like domain-containing protein [Bacteroidota bacterium]MDP4233431.1 carboxypeptidase regulatory-like domain-containing protein [Bacteroidota bacterium]MDP4242297.1 carboxypeptidase regulatory-like domain-containing protein [Bacteroidota bacterium]MDP4287053.1 carboxypeptidase regulatory-like domain-containing protein [Bacteroidota bacterium]
MKSFLVVLSAFAALSFLSCRTQTLAPDTGMATVKGIVSLANAYDSYTPPYSGVQISFEGTAISTITNDSGIFQLNGVPEGTYNVRFSKNGYGEVRWIGKMIEGGGNSTIYLNGPQDPYYRNPTLYKQPELVLSLHSAYVVDTTIMGYGHSYLILRGGYGGSTPITMGGIAVYISHSSDVSSSLGHYSAYYYHYYPGAQNLYDTTSMTFWEPIDLLTIKSEGFQSGDSVYIAVYGAPIVGASPPNDYYDPATRKYVLTSLNQTPSPVLGFKVP